MSDLTYLFIAYTVIWAVVSSSATCSLCSGSREGCSGRLIYCKSQPDYVTRWFSVKHLILQRMAYLFAFAVPGVN